VIREVDPTVSHLAYRLRSRRAADRIDVGTCGHHLQDGSTFIDFCQLVPIERRGHSRSTGIASANEQDHQPDGTGPPPQL